MRWQLLLRKAQYQFYMLASTVCADCGASICHFVRDTAQTVHAFTDCLRSAAVKHVYKQSAAYGGTSASFLAALANTETAAASALALQRLLAACGGQVTVRTCSNLVGNAATINDQVSELLKSANKDATLRPLKRKSKPHGSASEPVPMIHQSRTWWKLPR